MADYRRHNFRTNPRIAAELVREPWRTNVVAGPVATRFGVTSIAKIKILAYIYHNHFQFFMNNN